MKGDRRVFVRQACQLPVDFATTDHACKGTIKNISRHGVLIEAKVPLPLGEEVTISLHFVILQRPWRADPQRYHRFQEKVPPNRIQILR
ncbi:MAG: PilZ domain-containing protein [Deltaproteobacteria bacterium]|nr:PilZ domain-containing protein [Deltaproteobacteria bacterium]